MRAPRLIRSGKAVASVAGAVVLGILATMLVAYGLERLALRGESRSGSVVVDSPHDPLFRFSVPGISRPQVVPAASAQLKDDEEVIGVEIDGRSRAYLLIGMSDRSRHVVNDVLGETPISVSYCDLDNCVQAYVAPEGQPPLEIAVGGLYEGRRLVLEVGSRLYFQRTGRALSDPEGALPGLPFQTITPTRTTWGRWRELHPDTDVYDGRVRSAALPRKTEAGPGSVDGARRDRSGPVQKGPQ